jgi:hypothetical protein
MNVLQGAAFAVLASLLRVDSVEKLKSRGPSENSSPDTARHSHRGGGPQAITVIVSQEVVVLLRAGIASSSRTETPLRLF